MRGHASRQTPMFCMIDVELELPKHHPLRAIKCLADAILNSMVGDLRAAYSRIGRPSIPPEQLLKALPLQALYSIRSEIQLMKVAQAAMPRQLFAAILGRIHGLAPAPT